MTGDIQATNLDETLYSTAELAVMCDVTVGTVRTWIREGKIKAVKASNGRHYIPRAAAVEYASKRWGSS